MAGGQPIAWTPIRDPHDGGEDAINERYAFNDPGALSELIDHLSNLQSRDSIPNFDAQTFKEQRDGASKDVHAIVKTSKDVGQRLKTLRNRLRQFARDYEYNPSLMTSIMNIDLSDPADLFPESLTPFSNIDLATELFDDVDARLSALALLPLGKPPGPIINETLKRAVSACRDFWIAEHRVWKTEMLEQVTEQDDITILTGRCERFVADVLGATGFEFRASDLRAALPAQTRVKGGTEN